VFQNVMIRITSGMVDFTEWLNTIAKAAGKPSNELMGDLNNDGVPNVIDYLFLTSPDAQDIKRNWPKAKKVGADLMVEYTRVKNDDLTWRYQKTRNLTTFEPAVQGVDYTEMVETTGGGSTEKVTLQIFFSGKDPFLIRVEAVENPGVE